MTKGQAMDLDELKAAMARLGDREAGLAFPGQAAARMARRSIITLVHWQIAQTVAGILVTLAGGTIWGSLLAQPGLLFASGVLVNLYGAAMIALAVAGLAHARGIDTTAPIVETEGHMARLQRIRLLSGWVLGASWWVLWLPFLAVAVRLLWGADILAPIGVSAWLVTTLASGVVGLAGMWGLRRWAIRNGRARLAARLDDVMTGRTFREVRQRLDEVASFKAG